MSAFGRVTAMMAVASVAFASPAAAQFPIFGLNGFPNTGQYTDPGNTTDQRWFVTYCTLDVGGNCADDDQTILNRINLASVVQPGSLPSPPWYPNQSNAQWISVNPNAGMTPGFGDGVPHYRYIFGTVFTSSTPSFTFGYNSDNAFHGWALFNPNMSSLPFGITSVADAFNSSDWYDPTPSGTSGFCRTPDGAFGPPCPALSDPITVNGLATNGDPNIMLFKLDGDGQTDGLFVTSVTTTPEPSSFALLGTGLFGLVPMIRRRRKS